MLEGMPSQRGVVHLQVEFEIIQEVVLPEETDYRCGIIIVLVLGWFAGLGFNEKRAFETLLARVIPGGMQHPCKMLLFTLHVGIQQRHISLTATPKHVILPA